MSAAAVLEQHANHADVRTALAAYEGLPGHVSVMYLQAQGAVPTWTTYGTTPDELARAARDVVKADSADEPLGIYLRGTTVRTGTVGRGTSDDTVAWLAFRADLDLGKPGGPTTWPQLFALFGTANLPVPTYWQHSGGGFYPVWQLAEHVPHGPDVEQLARDIEAELRRAWNAAGHTAGVDSCHDAARVWRLAGSVHRKNPANPIVSSVGEVSGRVYATAELRAAVPAAPPATTWDGNRADVRRGTAEAFEATYAASLAACRDGGKVAFRSTFFNAARNAHRMAAIELRTREQITADLEGLVAHFWPGVGPNGDDRRHVHDALHNPAGRGEAGVGALASPWELLPLPAAPDVEIPPAATPGEAGQLNLPAEFWAARPSLTHIRDAALASWACPDAVLGAVLTRMSAYAHPGDHVDMGIGRSPLTLFAILYGSPSAGKGVAMRAAAELLPVPAHLQGDAFRERPIGSGEGITESYYGMESVTDEKGKVTKVRKQVRRNALFVMDEGETMVRLMTRNGSTLATTMRRAWSGEVLGEANASAERDRQLDRHEYSIGLAVAFQPAAIGPMFNDAEVGGGTPHRFLYLAADDDTLPELPPTDLPQWPGALDLPSRQDPDLVRQFQSPEPRSYVLVDEEARNEVQMVRWRGLRRDRSLGDLDGHMNQMRGRVAAHLAGLDGRVEVDAQDWSLAGQVVAVSNRVRESAIAYGRTQVAAAARREDERHVSREASAHAARLSVAEQREHERVARGAAVLARKVLRSAPTEGLATGALRDAAGRYKRDVAACLGFAVEAGWLVTETVKQGGTRYRIGPNVGNVPD